MKQRNIAVLGSTGSIGTQTLDVIKQNPSLLKAHTLVAGRNHQLLIEQALIHQPLQVVIAHEEAYPIVRDALVPHGIKVYTGAKAIEEVVMHPDIDLVLTAMVGFSGLRPTIAAIQAGKTIGLANKETLVVAGELIMPLAQKHQVRIIPVDSEHSAIYQCLIGETQPPERIILTASGGPFRQHSLEALRNVTRAQALKHPNWSMGAKVTIDSASLMNKGLEMIEARWLFDCPPEAIEIIIHPESIIHSMVQFADGSIKAQLGIPDMRLPISYALGLGERIANDYPRYDFLSRGLSFERPDTGRFPNLALAFEAIKQGGATPCALNASNEIAVEAFLEERISFLGISQLNAEVMARLTPSAESLSLELLEHIDQTSRALASELIPSIH